MQDDTEALTSHSKPAIVGLTGGIGSGKTSVSDRLKALGAYVVDTDVIAHQLTSPGGAAISEIWSAFGPESINQDGSMNRAYMRELVFEKPEARTQLESILHPMIRQAAMKQISHSDAPYYVLVVPLLTEKGGWREVMSDIVVVDCDEATQIERVAKRNAWPLAQIKAVINSQASRQDRLALATHVINNDGKVEELLEKVDALHKVLMKNCKN